MREWNKCRKCTQSRNTRKFKNVTEVTIQITHRRHPSFYLDQEGLVAASVDMHFPTPGEHKGLEDHWEDRNQYQNTNSPKARIFGKKAQNQTQYLLRSRARWSWIIRCRVVRSHWSSRPWRPRRPMGAWDTMGPMGYRWP